jgi:2-keto-3-deoxy-L-rhamnonate aldolase RhmA
VAAIPCAPDQVKGYHAMGYRFFNVMSDYRCVFNGMKAARAAVSL